MRARRNARIFGGGAIVSSLLAVASPARADASHSLVVQGREQDALGVAVEGGALYARVCPREASSKAPVACDPVGHTAIKPPAAVRSKIDAAELRKVKTSKGRELVELTAPSSDGRKWTALLAAGVDGAPRVVWSGFVAADPRADAGGATQYVAEKDGAGEKITITKHLPLCGRTVVSSRAALDPSTLELVERGIDDPVPDARKTAVKITAKKLPSTPKVLDLLHSPRASSGDADGLVDADPDSPWIEGVPGAGAHEFVTLASPESVGILGFDLSFGRPKDPASARAPKNVLLVTSERAYAVELPEDASAGGASFSVELTEPIHTRCVALVLGETFPEKPAPKPEGKAKAEPKPEPATFVGELSLRTKYEGATLDDLASLLQGGGDEARARGDLLAAAGSAGVAAAVRAYAKLDGPGRDLARRVVDAAGCEEKLALYVPMLASKDEDEVGRAHDRVRRCGREAAPALAARLDAEKGEARAVFAEELALLSPDTAIPRLVEGLSRAGTPAERLLFRRALVKASDRDSSVRPFDAALAKDAFAPLPMDAKLDLLRAMGLRLGQTKGGSGAFADVAREATDFRGRYLLIGPAASLARAGDQPATLSLAAALTKDPDARIRARAAEVAGGVSSLDTLVLAAATDPAVRVREAAAHSLEGRKLEPKIQGKLAKTLTDEPWTFVRRALVQSLGGMAGDAAVDASLAFAMEHEEQPTVRRDILVALGARGASSQRRAIKDRADDTGEAVDVRVEALGALGKICDRASIDDLTKVALKGATPYYEADRKLSTAAIAALGRLHPKDLAARLAPLLTEKVPGDVQDSARAALAEKNLCR